MIRILLLFCFVLSFNCAKSQPTTAKDASVDNKQEAEFSAFGYRLGDVLPETDIISVKGLKNKIEPLISYKIFKNYYAEITPDSRLIYRIDADGILPSLKQAKDEIEILRRLLSKKYGSGIDKVNLNNNRYLEFSCQRGVIRMSRRKKRVNICYIDFDTMIIANQEYQKKREQQNKEKALEVKKGAFRNLDAL